MAECTQSLPAGLTCGTRLGEIHRQIGREIRAAIGGDASATARTLKLAREREMLLMSRRLQQRRARS